MAAFGKHRVRLNVDLTRYHRHLVPGVYGTSVPGARTTDWGWQDRFWAVQWECCDCLMDTLVDSLTVLEDGES